MAVNTLQATINGSTYDLTYNSSSGKWESTISAPSATSYNQTNHYYPVTLTATDLAGNVTTANDQTSGSVGTALRLTVKETTKPTISVTNPTAGQYTADATPTIQWTVSDSGSGVDNTTIALSIDGTAVSNSSITITGTGTTRTCSYTPTTELTDGSHTLVFNASDNDGNAATAVTRSFNVLANQPALSITSPEDNSIGNSTTVTLSGSTDGTSVKYKLDSGSDTAVTLSSGSFSTNITGISNGTHTIQVTATGASGLTSVETRTITVDTVAPTISAVTITPNPVNTGATFTISVTVTD